MSRENEPSVLRVARQSGAEIPVQPLELGQRVREIRKARSWTLERAAQAAGLARSTLSKIENGQMSPTYDALKKLATGLEISVPQLFTAASTAKTGGRMAVTRGGEGRAHPTSTYEHELLAHALSKKMMLPYRARVRAREISEFDGWVRHEGEEFLYVLTGVVRLYTEFYEPVDLHRNDSAYYDATMGHNVVSISEDDASILWVTSMI